ncbi:hypothetical protein [Bordetella genomosp. 4]|uniref:Beta sliding clamp n=1 Tax=Bordetella genomosp. 4 TaxID=463044 RepID=A0A261URR2_9BORD|nr:hypothetical protein [Bordetella genomosp. 4]OZI64594.1 hypothetical protein CAL20_02760 [Bordetella genomosp. 4]
MTQPTILIDHLALKAASLIKAKSDIRYYLNGVYVEATKEQTIVVATDGHRLIALRSSAINEIEDDINLIIPEDALQRIIDGSVRNQRAIPATFQENGKWSIPLFKWAVEISFTPVPANYPVWRKVIPDSVSGVAADLNPKYLQDFQSAARVFFGLGSGHRFPSVEIAQNGDGAALVFPYMKDESFIGIVMPFKSEKATRTKPAWAQHDESKATFTDDKLPEPVAPTEEATA